MLKALHKFIKNIEKELGNDVRIMVTIGFRGGLIIRISQIYLDQLLSCEHAYTESEINDDMNSILTNRLKKIVIASIDEEKKRM